MGAPAKHPLIRVVRRVGVYGITRFSALQHVTFLPAVHVSALGSVYKHSTILCCYSTVLRFISQNN
jgi:hypothetical protein